MKAPHKIGIPPGLKVLYIERHEGQVVEYNRFKNDEIVLAKKRKNGCYRLWLHTSDRILGTYLAFWDNGKIERITVRDNEGDEIVTIKPAD